MIDLGSGDGRIVILAAKRFGATGLGVEIDPRLVEESRAMRATRAWPTASSSGCRTCSTDLGKATVITMYLLPEVNMQLRPRLLALKPGTRIVSHDWDLGDWKPDRTSVVPVPDKPVGLEKSSRVHLWVVPPRPAPVRHRLRQRPALLARRRRRARSAASPRCGRWRSAGRCPAAGRRCR